MCYVSRFLGVALEIVRQYLTELILQGEEHVQWELTQRLLFYLWAEKRSCESKLEPENDES